MKLNDLTPQAVDLDLQHLWIPFTSNRQFKTAPRLLKSAKGMYYKSYDDRDILDSSAGLWCVNAGHCPDEIVQAIQQAVATLDFAPPFNMGHPLEFQAASKIAEIAPAGLDRVFFTNSGSEAVDTALKIALAYFRARGEGQRTRFIGRERGYHGVGFGGISVGGISPNRKAFSGALLPNVDHLPHTHNLLENAFSRGQPKWGAHLADELERLVALHDPSTIAAVIVEPMAGSTGALIPPLGYLERLRELTSKYGILLIFDEVITGYGRLGTPFASQYFGVTPDIITSAKGVSNGTVPLGAVMMRRDLYDTVVDAGPDGAIEFAHGYTYSGHPLATAAACATLDYYKQHRVFERGAEMAPYFEEAIHSLKGLPHVIDIRNLGMVGAIELAARPGKPGARAFETHVEAFRRGLLVRVTGDIMAFSPPLIAEKKHVDDMFGIVADILKTLP